MSRATKIWATTTCLVALIGAVLASSASASFGFKDADVVFSGADGSPSMQAGSHPFAWTTTFDLNTFDDGGKELPEGETRNLRMQFPAGLVGSPDAVPTCSAADFRTVPEGEAIPLCPNSTAVGIAHVNIGFEGPGSVKAPVYNLKPAPGVAAKIGFVVLGVPVTTDIGVSPNPPYNLIADTTDISQADRFYGASLTVWGDPTSPLHDEERGTCNESGGKCPVSLPSKAFFMLPRSCSGPLSTLFEALPWHGSSEWARLTAATHDGSLPPAPLGVFGCDKLGFGPTIDAKPTTVAASSPTGLDFSLDVADEGLTSPAGIANSDIKKAVVTLPEGMTVNPSSAEGLEACTEADLARETVNSAPGRGCPDASKLGTVEVESPLIEENVSGSLFIAKPYENPSGSLLALYVVIKNPKLGIMVKQAGRVEPDPKTGRLISTFEDIPQLPFSHFRLHFREGARSPLVSPPACGDYAAEATLTPWSGGEAVTTTSTFKIISGVNASPCPAGGTPPFGPGFEAGSNNNDAGSFSPFFMRLTRRDGDQDLTRFSATLPPGLVAKLAGTTQCPEAGIAAARARTGRHGGEEELASPSCPASSQIGRVLAGAGVGAVLTYVPGKVYLAGPYQGAPLSVVAIVPAVAGPFDVGTVVTRQALQIDPSTAEVRVDDAASDPIPHILAGIPLKVRDVRVYVDRPSFTLNPTNCEPFAVASTLWGGGADVFGSADDSPLSRSSRFQAANCASLGFKPKLDLKLKGGTKRGGHPGLTATYTPRAGDANVKGLVVRLPRSAFLDQAHIRTICTRVQFAAKACPKGARYGFIKAWTPLLDEPLEGPVYLRSSSHKLPDLVFDLHGLVDVEVATRIDSSHGGIRATVEDAPDAPLSKVLLNMQGQKKGLIINSRDLCGATSKANVEFTGHNGKVLSAKPVMRAECGGGKRKGG
jgi:hypothetical protein